MKNILLALFFYFFCVPFVLAHTLKIDGNIGVNLHVDPDDAPVAGQESKFFVDIQDKSGRFNPNNPANCDCRLTIFQKDTPLKELPVTSGGSYTQIRYTFPSSGIYTVVIEGKSLGKGIAFQNFKTSFEYFVKPAPSENMLVLGGLNPLLAYAPYVALGVGIVIILLWM